MTADDLINAADAFEALLADPDVADLLAPTDDGDISDLIIDADTLPF